MLLKSLLLFALLQPIPQALAGGCEIRGVAYHSDPAKFFSGLNVDQWNPQYGERNGPLLEACKAEWKVNASAMKKPPELSLIEGGCSMRGAGDGPFGYLRTEWKRGKIQEIKLNYHEQESRVWEAKAMKEIVSKYGKAKKETSYAEEAFTHRLQIWKTKDCSIVLDSGSIGSKKSEALFLYFFPPDYKPGMGNPMGELFD